MLPHVDGRLTEAVLAAVVDGGLALRDMLEEPIDDVLRDRWFPWSSTHRYSLTSMPINPTEYTSEISVRVTLRFIKVFA